jgi:hypothetical protein
MLEELLQLNAGRPQLDFFIIGFLEKVRFYFASDRPDSWRSRFENNFDSLIERVLEVESEILIFQLFGIVTFD